MLITAPTYGRKPPRAVTGWAKELSSGRLIAFTLLYVAAICGLFAVVLFSEYQDVWKRALQQGSNISGALRQDIARNVEFYDLSLQAVVEGWEDPRVRDQPPELRRMILFDRAATAPDLGSILVLNAQGDILADSRSIEPRKGNFADADYFKAHQGHPFLDLYISQPFISPLDNSWSIGLSRRINRADGSFGGVVIGTIRLSYLKNLFDKFILGPNDSITLLRDDRMVLMRHPFGEDIVGRNLPLSAGIFQDLTASPEGHFVRKSAVDGVERLFVYGRVGDLPLVQAVGLALDDIVAPWRHRALAIAGAVAIPCIAMIVLTLLLKVQLVARAEAEARLTSLATRDPLTGLANRRSFDDTLSRVCSSPGCERKPLSLLMLDVDYFKLYNDAFGHPKGDTILRAVAACIVSSLRHCDELAARYGGEEFVILLPAVALNTAMEIAERVRNAVLARCLPHSKSALGIVTVSIGAATIVPCSKNAASDLLFAADTALYEAKKRGRNICVGPSEAKDKLATAA
jgi:diguanylate cyclase (GGDEF)-like protein